MAHRDAPPPPAPPASTAGGAGLACEGLAARLGGRTVLEGLSATFPAGTLTVLSGPNGAGKTTLLRCLARALRPAAGRVLLVPGGGAAAPVPAERVPRLAWARRVAWLPQAPDAGSLAGLSVREAVSCGRLPHTGFFGSAGGEDAAAVDAALRDAGLAGFESRDAASLSGGETRRMFLAACLAQEADVLLLDEPFEGLDASARADLSALLGRLLAAGRTLVVATHDLAPLAALPRRTLALPAGAAPSAPGAPPLPPPARPDGGRRPEPVPPAAGRRARPAATAAAFAIGFALLAWHVLAAPTRALALGYRLPLALCAFACGGVLSVCGCAYQTLFRNPMASPYTLGTASGATLGALLATLRLGSAASVGAAAFAGALLSLAVVRACGGNGKSARLLLGGIACAYLFSSATMVCQLALTPWESFAMSHWSLGSIVVPQGAWRAALPAAWLGALAFALPARALDAMLAGDDAAASHGIDAPRLRLRLLAAASLLAACCVAVCGPVGFVGLLVPHAARLLAGASHRRLVPVCAVGGGLFLALCDALARSLPTPGALPVGVVTALLGAPTLVALLARRGR